MPAGITPLPGTPMYEQYVKNLINAENNYTPGFTSNSDQMGGAATLNQWQQAVGSGSISPLGILGDQYLPGGSTGGSSGGSSSSMSSGAGLLNEILGLIRGTGDKEMQKARRRLTEDYDEARGKKMSDLARRGLFSAGIGEEEMQSEIDKPFTRGQSDLAGYLADANVDTSLRKAAILGDIEAQARRAQADSYNRASQIGSGTSYRTDKTGAGGIYDASQIGGGGDMFGAQFTDTRRRLAGGGGGGSGATLDPFGGSGSTYSGYYDPITGEQSGYSPPPGAPPAPPEAQFGDPTFDWQNGGGGGSGIPPLGGEKGSIGGGAQMLQPQMMDPRLAWKPTAQYSTGTMGSSALY